MGKLKVDFLIEIFMRFSLKGSWIQIHMPFLFVTVRSLLFQNSSNSDVTLNITYLLLLLETWTCEWMKQKLVSTIMVVIFKDFFMFYQIFLSQQVKQIAIISNIYTICLTSCRKIEIELFPLCAISHEN